MKQLSKTGELHQLRLRCEPLIASLSYSACKLCSVVDDEVVASNAASSVSHTHADTGAILVQTAFLEALGHSPHITSNTARRIAARNMVTTVGRNRGPVSVLCRSCRNQAIATTWETDHSAGEMGSTLLAEQVALRAQ